ncbi:MAG: iron ABC transporter permease [Rhodoferax sp.]|nr:iron ABC transporter permease [Rhodoferax sp.]
MKQWVRQRPLALAGGLAILALILLALGTCIGSAGLQSVREVWDDDVSRQIVWEIRLPRSAGAWAAGALLGLAGAVAQGLFRNPLADPYLLGSAAGASLGVCVALALLGASSVAAPWLLQLGTTGAAFVGATAAVLLTLTLARGVQQTMRLLLAGVVVGVVLGAASSLVLLAQPQLMQSMQGFMLGSTAFVGWDACVLMLGGWSLCMSLAWALSPVLDGLSLGESTALSLGLPVGPIRMVLVLVLALATGTAVAHTGLIAFVGLAAPHLVRALVRAGHARLVLLSSLMGGVLLLGADLLARSLLAPQELPVGVLTAVLGGGYLLWLMHRQNPVAAGAKP